METASSSSARLTLSSSSSIFPNYPLTSALLAVAIGQFTKLFASWYREKHLDLMQLLGSGGMPSSHAATVVALATAVGLQDGLGGSKFAIAFVFACIVVYDATGVRLHAGRQAEVLNQIVYELPAAHPLAESRPLRELLGHTPLQVILGCLLGILAASFGYIVARS